MALWRANKTSNEKILTHFNKKKRTKKENKNPGKTNHKMMLHSRSSIWTSKRKQRVFVFRLDYDRQHSRPADGGCLLIIQGLCRRVSQLLTSRWTAGLISVFVLFSFSSRNNCQFDRDGVVATPRCQHDYTHNMCAVASLSLWSIKLTSSVQDRVDIVYFIGWTL